MSIKRFASFEEIKPIWINLENQTPHYPFQSFWYQKLFAEKFCNSKNVYLLGVYIDETLLAIGGFEKVAEKIVFLGMKQVLGGQDITDYGDVLWKENVSEQQASGVWQTIHGYFKQQGSLELQLDFVREDSLTYKVVNKSAFVKTMADKQEVAPFIIPPSSWDEYLQSLDRKQRHELKRKIKRFEEQRAFHFCSNETIKEDFEAFIRLHRASDQAKEKFMSEEMKQFFWDIVSAEKTDYRIDFCFLNIDNKPVASVMSFIGQGKTLLYNSGFDPEYSYYSVGLILHAYLVKKSIEEKLSIHDFLRGNERYKYDLGAKDMQLYRITLTNSLPNSPISAHI
ncbi:MAG TPA: GNAT family N-acetyltransferase [Candidatus Saccharimonadales bacterium]|nr:GNAT family N-acetyltransferase [Candidatus Saccharimonadales bacterium]